VVIESTIDLQKSISNVVPWIMCNSLQEALRNVAFEVSGAWASLGALSDASHAGRVGPHQD
jgi:hypothetical protein